MKTNEVNKEISYETLLVTFGEGIGRLDTMFDDPQVWGVATLKQWIDGYETTRFTEIDDRTAVITSETKSTLPSSGLCHTATRPTQTRPWR